MQTHSGGYSAVLRMYREGETVDKRVVRKHVQLLLNVTRFVDSSADTIELSQTWSRDESQPRVSQKYTMMKTRIRALRTRFL